MAISVYDDQLLTEEQKRQLKAFTDAWNRANAIGDQAAMDSAHAAAERVRAQAGYSGGMDGSGYRDLGGSGGTGAGAQGSSGQYGSAGGAVSVYTPPERTYYQARTEEVNRLYDMAREAELAKLKSAFEESNAELEARRREIPGLYQDSRNAVAARNEREARSFNEYAAASGLNSGAGGQARLAMSGQLQGDLTQLDAREASDRSALEDSIARLRVKYQNDIAAAVAAGEYKRAQALLEEYRREEESRVEAANAMADDGYKAWQSQLERERYDYERGRDAASDDEDLRRRELELAELMAKYGDYSGLRALGVDTSGYEAERNAAGASKGSSGGSSGGLGGSGGSAKTSGDDWTSIYKQFREAGVTNRAEAFDYALRVLGLGRLEAERYAEFFEEALKSDALKSAGDILAGALGVFGGRSS